MNIKHQLTRFSLVICAASLAFVSLQVSSISAQAPAEAAKGKGKGKGTGFVQSNDPRVQNRTYVLAETGETMPYCLFVSSKVSPNRKNPLIVSLHGLGIGPGYMCQGKAIDLAEAGGYILVAPMGHNPGGWYGSPVMETGAAGKEGKGKGGTRTAGPPNAFSEKDVLNVLEIVRKEFNVDPQRTYLMGHSMGGAGTFHLGVKYASNWAAIAAMAPAAFLISPSILEPVKDTMPVFVVVGDQDNLMSTAREWVATMKELKVKYKYIELGGATHGSVIEQSMPDIFAFFREHVKSER
jgi:predicted peptidase